MVKTMLRCWMGLFSLGLVACGAVPDGQELPSDAPALADGPEAEIDDVSQALGAWRELFATTRASQPMHVGPRYTFIVEWNLQGDVCAIPVVVLTATGEKLNVPNFPSCGIVNSAISAGDLIVHHERGNTMYALRSGPNNTWSWTPIAYTNDRVPKMATDGQYVYWDEDWTVYRVHRLGSPVATLATDRVLVGVAGSDLYLLDSTGSGYDLKRRTLTGTNESTVRVDVDPGDVYDSSFDATHLYFSSNSSRVGDTNRIQRIARSGGALSTMKSSTAVRYVSPFSNGAALYWREERISDGAATIRRRNHSNGNHVTQPFPMAELEQMLVTSSGIYAVGDIESNSRAALMRGDL